MDRQRAMAAAAAAVRIGLDGSATEPLDRLEPGHGLQHQPDPRQVGEPVGDRDRLLDDDPAAGGDPEALLVLDDDARAGALLGRDGDAVRLAPDVDGGARQGLDAPFAPLRRPARRSGRCRWGRATGTAAAARPAARGPADRRRRAGRPRRRAARPDERAAATAPGSRGGSGAAPSRPRSPSAPRPGRRPSGNGR